MKTIENVNAFGCLKMKREIQERICDETKGMDVERSRASFETAGRAAGM
ncbi:MAG: hypothetical protein FWG50_09285 [Kiritimatiellaeota bacterium]|nr:hypothetical protein [Kiritimatiellota bacterium]